jgi:uncharacterized RDD family membrane protein YckC
VASKGSRLGARAIDLAIELILVVATLIVAGDARRPWTSAFLAALAITAYEAVATRWRGGTPGKRAVGLRVVRLDRAGRTDLPAALRRGALHAVFTVVPPILAVLGLALLVDDQPRAGWTVLVADAILVAWWVTSALADPLGRGFADRVADTMVVPERFAATVTARDLPGYADGARPPRVVEAGRVADADVRVRARLRRLDDAPLLAATIGLLTLWATLYAADADQRSGDASDLLVITAAVWLAVFVAHETALVHRRGTTPGHALAGLQIVDRRRGGPPSWGRSFARALVLGLTAYVPPLWPLLGVSLLMMRSGRRGLGLHDLAGRTQVISDPSLAPEVQRQRAMRLRLGRAG